MRSLDATDLKLITRTIEIVESLNEQYLTEAMNIESIPNVERWTFTAASR